MIENVWAEAVEFYAFSRSQNAKCTVLTMDQSYWLIYTRLQTFIYHNHSISYEYLMILVFPLPPDISTNSTMLQWRSCRKSIASTLEWNHPQAHTVSNFFLEGVLHPSLLQLHIYLIHITTGSRWEVICFHYEFQRSVMAPRKISWN